MCGYCKMCKLLMRAEQRLRQLIISRAVLEGEKLSLGFA